ncbi:MULTISPECIES: GIY-YIG nuclease family protein [Pseudomonas]|uniref:GIY-YIG nuclease family protein n=1 Tax=Pseudomonas luteola TaxID=47886 RepID=A0ABS0FPQ2_PSELU|nr:MULTISPECIES: GIY-YIG nuclease family protein [Pseudomonas]MBF8642292.1 GIY-YIG nuclease family protein [Pseudomonas zeshuii]RRW48326.1 GIY-YIG nuclease family protein [Pseudomonas luteola]SHJ23874.1 T5orf172 domain-containing protein [Pseudomonas zeshuii]
MNFGFIYCLSNVTMPGIYKIGMTDRAPSQRCYELSGSTSAPLSFDLLCYGEVCDARSVEAEIHSHFSPVRVNESREFFQHPYTEIRDVLKEHCNSFAETQEGIMEAHKEELYLDFLRASTQEARVKTLLSAVQFYGVKIWREGDSLKSRGFFGRHDWIFVAINSLQEELLKTLPVATPLSKVSLLLAGSHSEELAL